MKFIGGKARELLEELSEHDRKNTERLISLVTAFSIFAILSLLVFGAVHIYSLGNVRLGYTEWLFSGLTLLNIIYVRASGHAIFAANFTALLLFNILTVLLITGGVLGTGAYWFATLPVIALFLTGSRSGVLWVALFIAWASLLTWFSGEGYINVYYRADEMRQILSSMFVVAGMMYVFAVRIEKDEYELKNVNEDLGKKNFQLEEAVNYNKEQAQKWKKAEEDLQLKTVEMAKINDMMINREVKMVELKKQLSDKKHKI